MAQTILMIDNALAGNYDTRTEGRDLVLALARELEAFAGGHQTGTVGIIPAASAVKASGTITVASCVKTNSCVVAGITFTAVAETATPSAIQFRVQGDVSASGDAVLSGVVATDTMVIGGTTLTADASLQDTTHFKVGLTDIATATNLCTAIAANATIAALVTATNVGGTSATVTITAKVAGVEGNAITTTSAGGHITVAATLSGGTLTDTGTAVNLAAAINAHTTTNKVVSAAAASGVVTITALESGVAGNQIVLTSGTHLTAVAMSAGAGSFTTYHFGA